MTEQDGHERDDDGRDGEPDLDATTVSDLEPTEEESARVLGGPGASGNIGCKGF